MKRIKNMSAFIFTVILLWLSASFFDANIHNVGGDGYASWNIFVMAGYGNREGQDAVLAGRMAGDAVKSSENSDIADPSEKLDAMEQSEELYAWEDILLLAKLIEAENGSARHDETLILTGVCVLKRVKSKSYPDTIRGVIFQKGKRGRAYSTAPDLGSVIPSERAMEIAEELLVYGVDEYPDSLVFQSMFFQGREIYKKIDGEYFCLE